MDKRRDFIKKSIAVTGGMLIGLSKKSLPAQQGLNSPSIVKGSRKSRVVNSHRTY